MGWGTDAKILGISALNLVYCAANFGSQIWCSSAHINKVDTLLNNVMTGTVKSTPLQWLPVLANIKPPPIRRKEALIKKY